MKLQKDLREFIALLNSQSVEFVIVGGHAVAYHGYPRFTGDIDILIRPIKKNAERMLHVLREFGFGNTGIDTVAMTSPNMVIQLGHPPNRIDILTSISGIDFDEVWQKRTAGKLDDLDVCFIDKASLLKNKRSVGRIKDLADIEQLVDDDSSY